MASLIDALTEQLQLWLGETASISPHDLAQMLAAAQAETLQSRSPVTIRLEGEADDIAPIIAALKAIFPVTEQKANTAVLEDGRVRRELNMAGRPKPAAQPGNLDPQKLAASQKKQPVQPERSPAERLLYEALQTIAQGLLAFPPAGDGRRQFSSAYPAAFKDGISKLNAYYLGQGVVFDDPMEYWRLLSKPLKEWPHMPAYLQSPDPFIDVEGRITILTEHLARRKTD